MTRLDRAIIDSRDRLRSLRGERIRIENDLAQNTAAIERELNRVADLTRRLVKPKRR